MLNDWEPLCVRENSEVADDDVDSEPVTETSLLTETDDEGDDDGEGEPDIEILVDDDRSVDNDPDDVTLTSAVPDGDNEMLRVSEELNVEDDVTD
jgi:hypothetical protein